VFDIREEGGSNRGRKTGRERERESERRKCLIRIVHAYVGMCETTSGKHVSMCPLLSSNTELTMIQALSPCCSGVADDIDLNFSSVCRGSGHFGVALSKTMCSSDPHSHKSAT